LHLTDKLGGAFNTMKIVLGLALGPMMVPLLMGVIWKRVSWRGALLTFVVGLGWASYLTLVSGYHG